MNIWTISKLNYVLLQQKTPAVHLWFTFPECFCHTSHILINVSGTCRFLAANLWWAPLLTHAGGMTPAERQAGAHPQQGIIHVDIKPSNVRVGRLDSAAHSPPYREQHLEAEMWWSSGISSGKRTKGPNLYGSIWFVGATQHLNICGHPWLLKWKVLELLIWKINDILKQPDGRSKS